MESLYKNKSSWLKELSTITFNQLGGDMRNIIKLLEEDIRLGNYCSDEYEDYEEELLDLEDRSYDETLVMENYYERKYGK